MRKLVSAMKNKSTRDTITFLVPIVTAVVAGIWAVVTYFVPGHADRQAVPPAIVQTPPANSASMGPQATVPSAPLATPAAPANVSANNGIAIGGNVANSTITVSPGSTEQ